MNAGLAWIDDAVRSGDARDRRWSGGADRRSGRHLLVVGSSLLLSRVLARQGRSDRRLPRRYDRAGEPGTGLGHRRGERSGLGRFDHRARRRSSAWARVRPGLAHRHRVRPHLAGHRRGLAGRVTSRRGCRSRCRIRSPRPPDLADRICSLRWSGWRPSGPISACCWRVRSTSSSGGSTRWGTAARGR